MAKPKKKGPLKPGHGVPHIPDGGLAIFTDGSMLLNPRRGGWAYRLVFEDAEGHPVCDDRRGEGSGDSGINQMEVTAVAEALKEIQRDYMQFDLDSLTKVVVFTDSQYVADNYENALYRWSPYWFGADGQPIENAPEWKLLVAELKKLKKRRVRLEIKHAKGHNPLNPHNKAADKMARAVAEDAPRKQLRPKSVGRKLTSEFVIRGSVVMNGQELTIRVINHQHNPLTRTESVTYEVVDPESEFDGKADVITTTKMLSRWQSYRIRVNDVPKNPWIVEVLEKVESADGEEKG